MVNSRSLRFGRDDTSVLVEELFQDKSDGLQIPPLRYAPVGMTKGRVMFPWKIGLWLKGPSTSLRFGPTAGREMRDDKGEGDVSMEDWLVVEGAGPSTSARFGSTEGQSSRFVGEN
jgi:hypothetical protein